MISSNYKHNQCVAYRHDFKLSDLSFRCTKSFPTNSYHHHHPPLPSRYTPKTPSHKHNRDHKGHHIRVKHYIDNKIIAIIPQSPFPPSLDRQTKNKAKNKNRRSRVKMEPNQARGSQPILSFPNNARGENIHFLPFPFQSFPVVS